MTSNAKYFITSLAWLLRSESRTLRRSLQLNKVKRNMPDTLKRGRQNKDKSC